MIVFLFCLVLEMSYDILLEFSRILSCYHDLQMVHRDLSPRHLMIDIDYDSGFIIDPGYAVCSGSQHVIAGSTHFAREKHYNNFNNNSV